ncbi:UNVERIFIED_CONTAM: 7-deoxyloganetin glucosyltransferase [Sesamum radiatum]|uniref:7-deoxyloganetin glucosyltransferase n=1 Tax=Sesamum radiatum TaxID=300843 RepID=A0AAW2PZI4_SESRA
MKRPSLRKSINISLNFSKPQREEAAGELVPSGESSPPPICRRVLDSQWMELNSRKHLQRGAYDLLAVFRGAANWYCCMKWNIGMEIDSDVKRDEVEILVRKLMIGKEGREMKRRAMEWKKLARVSAQSSSSQNWRKLSAKFF